MKFSAEVDRLATTLEGMQDPVNMWELNQQLQILEETQKGLHSMQGEMQSRMQSNQQRLNDLKNEADDNGATGFLGRRKRGNDQSFQDYQEISNLTDENDELGFLISQNGSLIQQCEARMHILQNAAQRMGESGTEGASEYAQDDVPAADADETLGFSLTTSEQVDESADAYMESSDAESPFDLASETVDWSRYATGELQTVEESIQSTQESVEQEDESLEEWTTLKPGPLVEDDMDDMPPVTEDESETDPAYMDHDVISSEETEDADPEDGTMWAWESADAVVDDQYVEGAEQVEESAEDDVDEPSINISEDAAFAEGSASADAESEPEPEEPPAPEDIVFDGESELVADGDWTLEEMDILMALSDKWHATFITVYLA